jgi:hypothetical protein
MPQNRPVAAPPDPRYAYLPVFEAYFSNFIEGTEFELDEAVALVYGGKTGTGHADDSHNLLGTYKVLADPAEMTALAAAPGEFSGGSRARATRAC